MADVVENLNVMHKEVYPNGVPDLVPAIAKIQNDIKFDKTEMLGSQYVQPVRMALPGGFTHALGDGTAGAFALNDSKAGTQAKALVTGCQILLRDQMAYEDAAKATGGKKSFAEGTKFFYEGMQKSMRKRIESELLYGSVGIGILSAYTGGTPSITIKLSDWAPMLWTGCEGTEIDIMSGTSSTVRGTATIVSVDPETRIVTLSTTVTGAAANDVVYFKGGYGNEMAGIHKIMSNTTSLFNISAATYSAWKSSNLAVTGAMSFNAVKKAITKAVGKGLMEDVKLYVNHGGWDDIASDISSLRTLDKSEVKKVDIGSEEIVYHSQNGKVEIISHPMVKEGFAYGLVSANWKRIGSADVVMGAPGFGGEPFFHLQSKAGVEARSYTNQAIFSEMPATSFYISGIVNTTAP
jgi:hypothetical protein